jgi:hypothetical protein
MLVEEKEKVSTATAGSGVDKTLDPMVRAAKAPTAAFLRSMTGLLAGLGVSVSRHEVIGI